MPSPPGSVAALSIEFLAEREEALAEFLAGVEFAPSAPSRLPDWSIGHVLTHLARNADSHREMLDGGEQYGGSAERRDTEIESGAGRSRTELIDDVRRSGELLIEQWSSGGVVQMAKRHGGLVPVEQLRLLRCREVEIHRTDLGLGYGFEDLPAEYVRRELRVLEMQYLSRFPMGLTRLPEPVLQSPPSSRLAWLLGRAEIDGAPPADS